MIHKKTNPVLFDKLVGEIQDRLADNLPWLDNVFGIAERLVKEIQGKRYYTPNVYVGRNEYELIAPDSGFGNYCFFVMEEPTDITLFRGLPMDLKTPFSLVVWVDLRTIENEDDRNTQYVMREVLRTFANMMLRNGSVAVDKCYTRNENVFKGFSLEEIDNQYLMHPYAGFRFVGELNMEDECV